MPGFTPRKTFPVGVGMWWERDVPATFPVSVGTINYLILKRKKTFPVFAFPLRGGNGNSMISKGNFVPTFTPTFQVGMGVGTFPHPPYLVLTRLQSPNKGGTMTRQIWNFGGQLYAHDGTRSYTRWDGAQSELTVWRTHCADCGVMFEVTTSEQTPKYPTRRCPRHASKGHKVKAHVLWGKPVPLAELLGECPQITSTKSKKRTAASILAGPRRRPDHTNPQEERYGC